MAPLFSQKTYLIVKNKGNIQDDSIVIVLDIFNNILIRKYITLKGEKYLISSNPSYDIINFDDTMTLIGIVIEGRIMI